MKAAHRHSRQGRRGSGFILLPVALLLALVAAVGFLGHRETALASATAAGTRDQDKARYAAEAGLQRVTMAMHAKGCSGIYPTILSPSKDTAFDGASYSAVAGALSGSPVTVYSTGTYGDASITLTRSDVPMHQASTVTMTLQPASEGTDTYLDSASSSSNGNKGTLIGSPGTSLPILRFDLSAIPAGSHVTAATLSAYAEGGSNSGPVALHRMAGDWTEAANWSSSDGSTAWSAAGGDVHGTAVASATFSGAGNWLNWDVAALADRWIKGSLPNQGVQVRPAAPISSLTLTSSDGSNASQRPKLAVTFLPPCGWTPPSTTVTLNPVADTDIDGDLLLQTSNFGSQPDLYLSKSHEARPLLKFDLAGIPAGKTVQSATLRMYFGALAAGTKLSKNLTADVYAASKPWNELEVTWLRSLAGTLWLTLGGDYNSTAIATKTLAKNLTPGQWVEFTVTTQVQSWVDSASTNHGFLLRLPTASSEELIFNSREAASNPPELVVTYQ
ncbi:DNRLRE domain-containing protein [Sphaerotilus microaerophilus]|uniref:Carbohydrate-binding module family 96 domain-containing protein n=1 Tax=Sphaerotilus microaerophilus TaxID=2914710 RepID=A0ABM7YJV9_9BURK|nr:DNRLRE domain-containing protein [Sphaerotilus sp. FB-5]BDI04696.1 hypothetical protein CATMQ487_16660 [Sphaerotilus sp. FB-5]